MIYRQVNPAIGEFILDRVYIVTSNLGIKTTEMLIDETLVLLNCELIRELEMDPTVD